MLKLKTKLWLVFAMVTLTLPHGASADLLQSTHFRLDPNAGSAFGGSGNSTHYALTDAGGQAVNGSGTSQSYQLGEGYIARLPQSIQLTVLPSGTYAYWPFDTGTGTRAYDLSTNEDDASLIGSPSWTTGIVGQAVLLNGSSQYVVSGGQLTGPTAFTEEIWFKSTSSNGGYLMGFGDASSGSSTNLDRLVYMNNAGQLTFGVNPGSRKTVTTTASYNDGSWHHVAASLGSSGLLLYVDGIRQGTDASTTTAGSYSGYWRMGYDNLSGWPSAPNSNYLAGTIDEARVYSRQLSDIEVTGDYTAGANALESAFTLPNITPGISQNYSVDLVVRTNAPSYSLSMQAPHPLTHTDTTTTFPNISGTIASPILWNEGTTKGFGFTLTAGYGLESSWGTSPNYEYAQVPSTSTVFHTRPGTSMTDGSPEVTTVQYRADATSSQKQGTYSTNIIYTATLKP